MFPTPWVGWNTTGVLMQHYLGLKDGLKMDAFKMHLHSNSLHFRYNSKLFYAIYAKPWPNGYEYSYKTFVTWTNFQAGPRICLGKDSAYLQMKMALAILCRFYEFKLVKGHIVKYRMMTILSMANGLKVSVSRR